jgi:hypothetical protein
MGIISQLHVYMAVLIVGGNMVHEINFYLNDLFEKHQETTDAVRRNCDLSSPEYIHSSYLVSFSSPCQIFFRPCAPEI